MKKIILCINLLLTVFVYSQDKFIIKENGLAPKFLISKTDSLTKPELYKKTIIWIKENEKKYKLTVDNEIKNEIIHLTSIKGNAVHLNKQYFNAKYKISLRFEDGQYKFEPSEIQLKVNSKYDMGWKKFDLDNCDSFFKKGKVRRKYKPYLKDITALLNELNLQLDFYLKTD